MSLDPKPRLTERNSAAEDDTSGELERRRVELRGRISDIGYEIDAAKAVMALMVGGGVFLLLLGLLAAYDLMSGKAGIYQPLGITRETLKWVAFGCGGLGGAALAQALMRRKVRDRAREIELARLEEEYAHLRELHDSPPL